MMLAPGSTIGIVGGGQLGRMLAMAAAQLGYKCHVYAPDEAPPAAEVAARFTRGAWDDEAALAAFGREVDVATYEFENIAAAPARRAGGRGAAPPARGGARGRAGPAEREESSSPELGGSPAPFRAVDDRAGPGRSAGRARRAGGPEDPALRL